MIVASLISATRRNPCAGQVQIAIGQEAARVGQRDARQLDGRVPAPLREREPAPGAPLIERDVVLVPRARAVVELHAAEDS